MTNPETPEENALEKIKEPKKSTTANNKVAKVYKNPEFVDMINPKGVTVEIHKDRVDELKSAGYKLLKD